MMEPTKEQKQWFWEQCGIQHIWVLVRDHYGHWTKQCSSCGLFKDNAGKQCTLPINLNNLFKYAVPKLWDLGGFRLLNYQWIGFARDVELLRHGWSIHFEGGKGNQHSHGDDPALALFWAIYKALGGNQ